jgi:hypothetical protein
MIAPTDLDLLTVTNDPEEIVSILARSYAHRTRGHTPVG